MVKNSKFDVALAEFAQTVADLRGLKETGEWDKVAIVIDRYIRYLVDVTPEEVCSLTEIDVLARLMRSGLRTTYWIPYKKMMLVAIFKEAGDYAKFKFPPDGGFGWYLKGLHFLLSLLANDEMQSSLPIPSLDEFLAEIKPSPLPLFTRFLLMSEFERRGQFGNATDQLDLALNQSRGSLKCCNFGIACLERIGRENNATIQGGGLTRDEIEKRLLKLNTFRRRKEVTH
jgi:hypothetical protein